MNSINIEIFQKILIQNSKKFLFIYMEWNNQLTIGIWTNLSVFLMMDISIRIQSSMIECVLCYFTASKTCVSFSTANNIFKLENCILIMETFCVEIQHINNHTAAFLLVQQLMTYSIIDYSIWIRILISIIKHRQVGSNDKLQLIISFHKEISQRKF